MFRFSFVIFLDNLRCLKKYDQLIRKFELIDFLAFGLFLRRFFKLRSDDLFAKFFLVLLEEWLYL